MFIPVGGLIQLSMTAFDMVKFVMNEGSRIACGFARIPLEMISSATSRTV
jgi:hypothetical protein